MRWLVGEDIRDTHVLFKIVRRFPDRLLTKNLAGEWLAMDDPKRAERFNAAGLLATAAAAGPPVSDAPLSFDPINS